MQALSQLSYGPLTGMMALDQIAIALYSNFELDLTEKEYPLFRNVLTARLGRRAANFQRSRILNIVQD
jgi:hypothetical protein